MIAGARGRWLVWVALALPAWWVAGGCAPVGPPPGQADAVAPLFGRAAVPVAATSGAGPGGATNAAALLRSVNLRQDLVPRGTHGRKVVRPMTPRYITIHSTQNWSAGADAWRHSQALKNGKLRAPKVPGRNRIGYLIWHFTVDDKVAVQHLPTNEQGEHADFDGPGNRYSIGIEMCEHRGSNLQATIDRTARLTAWLMDRHGIPLRNVVPHYHWPRRGLSQPHKDCPHFLLDNGRPGRKWQAFLRKVDGYSRQLRAADLAVR
jgi:N-acetylmuramoyl-L-alanine amidase